MTPFPSPLLRIRDIVHFTNGTLVQGRPERTVLGISTDSRVLAAGNLFIPLAGPRFNGHDFLTKAVSLGAEALMTERHRRHAVPALPGDIPWIEVSDTLKALGDIAHGWRKRMNCRVVAVTGSAGKTTTKEMIAAIGSLNGKILKTEGNLNNLIGLPLTLLGLREETELAIVELGTSGPGEIARLAGLAEPDIGVITNIGPAHLEGLGSVVSVREEKGKLFSVMNHRGVAILNLDDPEIAVLRDRWRGEQMTFSMSVPADITAENIRQVKNWKTAFRINIQGVKNGVVLSVPGRHNVQNALAAAAAASAAGCAPYLICRGLNGFRPIAGRMEIEPLANGAHLIHDAYNANPLSVDEALKTLTELSRTGRRIVVFGDMLELGNQAVAYHKEIGHRIGELGIYALFLKGAYSRVTAEAAEASGLDKNHIFFFDGNAKAIPALRETVSRGDWILLKGSRKMNLEELIPEIRLFGKPGNLSNENSKGV